MKKKNLFKIIGLVIVAGLLVQTAIAAYGSITKSDSNANGVDISKVQISEEVQNVISRQDPDHYETNLVNYKVAIVQLNIDDKFKAAIEKLIVKGRKLPDILISYEFLNDRFGTLNELEELVLQGESGIPWVKVFDDYTKKNPGFVPRSFDSAYLEKLMSTPEITKDDIMIADRVSQKTGIGMEVVTAKRIGGQTWKEINAGYNVLNALDKMPVVPVTKEELDKFTADGTLSKSKVVETLVCAFKLGLQQESAIRKVKEGYSIDKLFAEALEEKYR